MDFKTSRKKQKKFGRNSKKNSLRNMLQRAYEEAPEKSVPADGRQVIRSNIPRLS